MFSVLKALQLVREQRNQETPLEVLIEAVGRNEEIPDFGVIDCMDDNQKSFSDAWRNPRYAEHAGFNDVSPVTAEDDKHEQWLQYVNDKLRELSEEC